MTETATHELNEAAPPAFVNGDATHRHVPARGLQRAPKTGSRREAPKRTPNGSPIASGPDLAWPDGLAAALRLHVVWRDGVTTLAREQLAFLADAGSDLVAAGQALAEEPDPARRMELVRSQALRQLERSLGASSRLIEVLASSGRDLLEATAAGGQRPG
jgi:Phasin protein